MKLSEGNLYSLISVLFNSNGLNRPLVLIVICNLKYRFVRKCRSHKIFRNFSGDEKYTGWLIRTKKFILGKNGSSNFRNHSRIWNIMSRLKFLSQYVLVLFFLAAVKRFVHSRPPRKDHKCIWHRWMASVKEKSY